MTGSTESNLHKNHSDSSYRSDGVHTGFASRWQDCLAITLLIALVSYFWWPALAAGKVIVHADSAHHGLSLLTMLHQWLHQELDSLLWSPSIYGGHPLFAESQGGFLNPLNLVAAYLFSPTVALGIVHWLDMLASGLGVYSLCRLLNLGAWPALFAAVAVTHGTLWLMGQNNLAVHGTMVWVAWTMAAVQYWLNAPSLTRALLVAVPATFIVYSGYPHLAHGLAVFFVCMMIGWLLRSEGRAYLSENLGALAAGSVAALILAFSLSAVQLLPLLELVANSHRSEGVQLSFIGMVNAKSYFSGTLFFSWFDRGGVPIGLTGILSASILVALCVLLRVNYTITGYLLATFVLYNLGIGNASPLFRFVYEYGLIPGLRGFRLMQPFLLIAVVGLGVLTAVAISKLSSISRLVFIRPLGGGRLQELPVLVIFFLLCLVVSYYFYMPSMSGWNYVFGITSLAAIVLLIYIGKRHWIGPVLALLLVGEMLVLRHGIYNFYNVDVLARPESVAAIQKEEDYQDYYSYSLNSRIGYAFLPPNRPDLDVLYRYYLGSLSPLPALQWGVSSINGALALDLHRRAILDDVLQAESLGNSAVLPGQRLIDVLGVRYFSYKAAVDVPGFTNIYSRPDGRLLIYRNDYAQPKLRTYFSAQRAASPDEAMDMLTRVEPGTIVIESDTLPVDARAQPCPAGVAPAHIERRDFSSQYYRIAVDSPCSGWLYLGDAYYPGWSAQVDGEPAPLYPAQVLGKAVRVPQGSSVVEFIFTPRSFFIGTLVSSVAWIGLCVFMLWRGISVVRERRFRTT
ncbi:MAG: hypothetical protein KDI17_15360 [Halioglobus sp.]|nr:hypothetical protein [Halioglobus sp.]